MADIELPIFDDLLPHVVDRSKDLDVRIGYYRIVKLKHGDRIRFRCRHGSVEVRVTAVRDYPSITKMLEHEDHRRIAPSRTPSQLAASLHKIYPEDKRFGVYVIEFEKEE